MKIFLSIALVLGGVSAAVADPIVGTWKTAPQDDGRFGFVTIRPCGPAFCGVLTRAFDAHGTEGPSPDIGKRIIWDMLAKGGGQYASGKIWSPDRDETYNGKMTLNGDTLSVSGCVLVFCRDGGTWTRVK